MSLADSPAPRLTGAPLWTGDCEGPLRYKCDSGEWGFRYLGSQVIPPGWSQRSSKEGGEQSLIILCRDLALAPWLMHVERVANIS